MNDRAKEIVQGIDTLREALMSHDSFSVSYAGRDLEEAANFIEDLSSELEAAKERENGLSIMLTSAQSAAETYKRERDRYWDFIRAMECESCSGDCGKCVKEDEWHWCGEGWELSQNADS